MGPPVLCLQSFRAPARRDSGEGWSGCLRGPWATELVHIGAFCRRIGSGALCRLLGAGAAGPQAPWGRADRTKPSMRRPGVWGPGVHPGLGLRVCKCWACQCGCAWSPFPRRLSPRALARAAGPVWGPRGGYGQWPPSPASPVPSGHSLEAAGCPGRHVPWGQHAGCSAGWA